MRAFLILLATPACIPFEPPGADPSTSSGSTGPTPSSSTGWDVPPRDRGTAAVSTSTSTTTTTSTSSPPATTEPDPDPDPTTSTGDPLPGVDLTALQLGEIHPDPDGKDGGPDSPEFLEIVHVGDEPLPLAGLEVVARSWPTLDAADLGIADLSLLPGQRLVIARYALVADLPDPALTITDDSVQIAFAADGGLRNADGGVLLCSGEQLGDRMIYGMAQPAPWDGEGWSGPAAPAPGSGVSLCRLPGEDHDDASDWIACPPSPGLASETMPDTTGGASETGDGTTGEPLPAEVVIVEVLSNPVGPGDLEKHVEFVEIENLGPGTVDLAGWTIADSLAEKPTGADPLLYLSGDGGCLPATCLAPGQRAVLVGNVYTGAPGAGLRLVTDDTTLANAGLAVHEPVALRDAGGSLRSTYRAWPDPLVEPDPALTEQALVRVTADAADAPEAWSFADPTPGF